MNVVVCIKQVPGKIKIEIDPQTNTLIRGGSDPTINPFDMYALEEGIRLKERYQGKVTVISMGPPQVEGTLREAVALGADEAILLSDPIFEGSDTWATSYVLSKGLMKLGQFDIVLCGRQSIDGETGQVGPQLAELMGLPFVSYVSKVEEVRDGQMKMQRMVEEGHQLIEMTLPGVISVVKEINVPRLPSLRGLMQSKKARITVWTARELGVDANKVGLSGSPTQIVKVFYPQRTRQVELLQGSPESQVNRLIEKLRETKVL